MTSHSIVPLIYIFKTGELSHELLEEQNVNAEVTEQLAHETKEKLKLKETLQFEKERADEIEKVITHFECENSQYYSRYEFCFTFCIFLFRTSKRPTLSMPN